MDFWYVEGKLDYLVKGERLIIYLAGPLFTEADRQWISRLKGRILALALELGVPVELIWPWELFSEGEIAALGCDATEEIFTRCKTALSRASLVIALLDGTQVDDGTAWEIGYFYCLHADKSRIIGIRTDDRQAGECSGARVNAMIQGCCSHIATSSEQLLSILRDIFLATATSPTEIY